MSTRRSLVWIMCAGLALTLMGCPEETPIVDSGPVIELDAGPGDGGQMADGGTTEDADIAVCNVRAAGSVPGANCNRGMCQGGMACNTPWTGIGLTDIESPDGTESATYPIHMFPDELAMPLGGGHCGNFCDPAGPSNQCGECGLCAESPLQGRIRIGWLDSEGRFDFDNGMCSFPCVPTPGTNGGCRDGYACDTTEGYCTASCFDDSQCKFGVQANEFGIGDIVYDGADAPWACNTTTGMCEPTGATGTVGDTCETNADCPAFGGFCIQGVCWQGGCGYEEGFTCEDGDFCVGIESLGRSGFCIPGCTSGDDCESGNGCVALMTEGSICFPSCETDTECRSDERCDLSLSDDGMSGACAPATCTLPDPGNPLGMGCAEDEICEAVAAVGANFCHTINQVCEADAECNGSQRCELWPDAAFTGDLGMCQDACTDDTGCEADEYCNDPDGDGDGNCRLLNGYCADGLMHTDCGRGQTCEIMAERETGFCAGEPTPPPAP